MRLLKFLVKFGFFCAFWGVIACVGLYIYAYATYGKDLPTVDFMKDYAPPTVSRFHAADGQLIAEHATERRLFVPVDAIPEHVKGAFLSAEDKDFYSHSGVDYISVAGAVVNNAKRYLAGRRLVGASTITQQVAKNFLTDGSRKVERKIREAFIAWRLEAEFSKDEILELYLNEVEFGRSSFGLASAALTFFNKSVKDLSVEEAAYLAATLKGPNNYDPVTKAEAAKERRDWVISQMQANGYVNEMEALVAKADPVTPNWGRGSNKLSVPYFSEEVLRQLNKDYGKQLVLEEGLSVRATLDPKVQEMAERALQNGLNDYDRRHGWRGALGTIDLSATDWNIQLQEYEKTPGVLNWKVALVYQISDSEAKIVFSDETGGFIKLSELKWARPVLKDQKLGRSVNRVQDVLSPGDVVAVSKKSARDATWNLQQVPDVQGAVVVMDPHTGRVKAIVGGYDFEISQFNRATQALRQPGSTFKPFVYLAALDSGKTPETKVLDSPVVVRMQNDEIYKPRNSDGRFLGLQPMRMGLETSRNLMTLRLAQEIGMEEIVKYADTFGIDEEMRPLLSMALGSGGTNLMRMTGAYAILANGGKKVRPTLIDRVQDRKGTTIRRLDVSDCPTCLSENLMVGDRLPILFDKREQVADPVNVYHVVSMMQGVVKRGTAKTIGRTIDRPVAGKTGTTNKNHDAWFIGFTPDVVIGVWVGFDKPRTLGKSEYGGRAAAPIFRDLLNEMLVDEQPQAFRVPKGINYEHIDPITGAIKVLDKEVVQTDLAQPVARVEQNIIDQTDNSAALPQPSDIYIVDPLTGQFVLQPTQPTIVQQPIQPSGNTNLGGGIY